MTTDQIIELARKHALIGNVGTEAAILRFVEEYERSRWGHGPVGYSHDLMDQIAENRYRVVVTNMNMFYPFAVVAGDGERHLYKGRLEDCKTMARRFAGAFLDGAFMAHGMLEHLNSKKESNNERA